MPGRPHALGAAFAGEVALRVPGMRSAAADVVASGAPDAARALRAHAHTLASSAAVMGESLASAHARSCEELLAPWCDELVPVPPPVATAAAREAETVALLLAPWLLAPGAGR